MSPLARTLAGFVAALTLVLATATSACLWDTDTLWQERQEFPGTLELIVGKFPRHTEEFYEWRVSDRGGKLRLHELGEAPLSDEERAAAYDDLAVALDKLGRREEALQTLDDKVADVGDLGAYETAANRGTILIHAGRYEDGLKEIDRALELNPDAHFGRERIQKYLVEYLVQKRAEAESISMPLVPEPAARRRGEDFAAFLQERGVSLTEGRKGVEGMMRFGDYRSAVLLEALGDLLYASGEPHGGDGTAQPKLLAGRAYLAAARSEPEAEDAYRSLAAMALQMQQVDGEQVSVDQIAEALDREFEETEDWFEKVREDEQLWIEASPNPEERFKQKYGIATLRVGDLGGKPSHIQEQWSADARHWKKDAIIGVGGAFTIAGVWALIVWRRRQPNGWETE
ncbi:MAG: hypothetical protein AAF907_07735 [Planctomycetota bacterium]